MEALLQCGHGAHVSFGHTFAHCPHCKAQIKIQALECRIWVVSCWQSYCRYRCVPCGSVNYGRVMADKHRDEKGHQSVTVDYIIPDEVKDEMREAYGRSVKSVINDPSMPAQFVTRKVDIVALPECEEPPFLWVTRIAAAAVSLGRSIQNPTRRILNVTIFGLCSVTSAAGRLCFSGRRIVRCCGMRSGVRCRRGFVNWCWVFLMGV